MSHFEYVSIFNGIIVALALENVAASFHKLLDAGRRVRWHWMAPVNAIGSATAALGAFWLTWLLRDVQGGSSTFLTFMLSAFASVALYLVCATTLPDEVPEAGIDLKVFYFSSRRLLWSLVLAAVLLRTSLVLVAILRTNFDPRIVRINTPFLIGQLVAAAIAVSMVHVRAYWWHAVGIVVVTAGVLFLFGPMKL